MAEVGAMEGSPVFEAFAITIFEGGGGVAPCGMFYCNGAGIHEVAAPSGGWADLRHVVSDRSTGMAGLVLRRAKD
jgi:hypothetical protein